MTEVHELAQIFISNSLYCNAYASQLTTKMNYVRLMALWNAVVSWL